MAKLNKLENNYPMDYREAFENLATHIFCVSNNLTEGVNRPVNKKGMESDSVQIGEKVVAYQAKYYDAATKMKDKKEEFIDSVLEARRQGITDLLIFVNKDHTEDSKTGEKPAYLKEIESIAQGSGNEPIVKLDWWTLSRIELALDMPEYQYVRDIYLGNNEDSSQNIHAFYEDVYDYCSDSSDRELYGGMSLLDSYIEPTLEINDTDIKSYSSVCNYLENFVDSDNYITVICGEPGHGKTSLCYKAMCDYYKKGWLAGNVSNVFCFSLNPASTNALLNDSLYLYALLSWGDDRQSNVVKKEDCRKALIFFDGFDELIEWYPKINLENFIKNYIVPFQKNTRAHVVITSRTMAVEPEKKYYSLKSGKIVPVNRLQPIEREKQYLWIEKYIQHIKKSSPEDAAEAEKYFGEYKALFNQELTDEDSINNLLGIPIIFRMIVTARYIPKTGQHIAGIYNDLFDITWERHRRQDSIDSSMVKAQLAKHALQIYLDNNDTAESNISGPPLWIFSFYTTHEGSRRIGFLHRSFYQYFLAYEVLTFYREYAYDSDEEKFTERLSYLARRKLDKATLGFIEELYTQTDDKESFGEAIEKSYAVLKMTDGILPLPKDKKDSEKIEIITPLGRANNVFWNVISIGSICGKGLSADSINDIGLQIYDMRNCTLRNAKLQNKDFSRAEFSAADFSGAELCESNFFCTFLYNANLNCSDLTKADITEAELIKANLYSAILYKAKVQNTDLIKAELSKADLREADFRGADLEGAVLYSADLRGANFQGAKLCKADLRYAILGKTDMQGANVNWAIMTRKEYDYISKQSVKGRDRIIIVDEGEQGR